MTQALYAHMNNKTIKKRVRISFMSGRVKHLHVPFSLFLFQSQAKEMGFISL
jgi:hypothetical protein